MLHRALNRMQLSWLLLILCFTYRAHGATTAPPVTETSTVAVTSTAPATATNATTNTNPTTESSTSSADTSTDSATDSTASMSVTSTASPTTVVAESTTSSSGNSSTAQSVTATESSMGDNSSTEGVTSAVTSPESSDAMNVSSTTGSTVTSMDNSTATEASTTGGDSSTTDDMSGVTSPATNDTSGNETSTEAATSTVTPSTTAIATAPTTPQPQPFDPVPYAMNTAMFKLHFTIADGGQITSACNASEVKTLVEDSFRLMSGYLYTITNDMSGMTSVDVYFRAQTLLDNSDSTSNATRDALVSLNNTDCLNLTSEFVQQTSTAFAAASMQACSAEGVCPAGYSCQATGGCQHLCAQETCSSHGTCYLNLTVPQGAVTACSCGEEGMYYYGGDKCQNQILKPDIIIAIIAGILGSVCFILFVILIAICIRRATANTSKYEMNGHFNEGYQEHSLSKL